MFAPKDNLQPSQTTPKIIKTSSAVSRAPATNVVEENIDDIDSTIAIINQAEALKKNVWLFIFLFESDLL